MRSSVKFDENKKTLMSNVGKLTYQIYYIQIIFELQKYIIINITIYLI